ncbi:MAG: 2-amino-4-hydroxy-6-hydroxymethyldihydropteridine diphosphokinase [Chlorobium sp.]
MAIHEVYIGIGSNIGNRLINLQGAIDLLNELDKTSVNEVSAIYMTEPIGEAEQRRFYNGVILLETSLSPEELRRQCKTIEQKLGRPANYPRWSPRAIDLDILLYDDLCLNTETLSIPHPELEQRKFVLVPLLDIANPLHPKTGKTIRQHLGCSKDQSVLIKTKEHIRIKKRRNAF